MKKPQMKTRFKVCGVYPYTNTIFVSTDRELAYKYLSDFGVIGHSYRSSYILDVDSRFDFNEVADYLKNLELEFVN